MTPTEAYILELPDNQRQIMQRLHDLLLSFPKVTTKIRYKIPFFYQKKWLCYLNPIKKNGVELCFLKGSELSNEQGILEATERKMVRGIKIYSTESIDERVLREVINEAILFDDYSEKKRSL